MGATVPLSKQERVRALRLPAGARYPEFVEATELVNEPEPDRMWVIENFVERQGRIILFGPEGGGKSLLALTIAVQAASGIPVLDQWPVAKPLRVLYCDLEMSRSSIRTRLRGLIHQAKDAWQIGNLYLYARPEGINLLQSQDRLVLEAKIGELEPDLLILDPVYKLTERDFLKEEEVKPVLKYIDRVRVDYGSAVLLVNHPRKRSQEQGSRIKDASDMYGGSILLRWPEVLLHHDEGTDSLKIDKDRDNTFKETRTFALLRGGYWPLGIGDVRPLCRDEVLAYLSSAGAVTMTELVRAVPRRRQDVLSVVRQLRIEYRIVEESGRIRLREDGANV